MRGEERERIKEEEGEKFEVSEGKERGVFLCAVHLRGRHMKIKLKNNLKI